MKPASMASVLRLERTHRRIKIVLVVLVFSNAIVRPAAAQKPGDEMVLTAVTRGTERLLADDLDGAGIEFTSAAERIDAIWSDTPEAQALERMWSEEKIRPFRGEAYERMMAFYYAGVISLIRNDWGRAQAAFYRAFDHDRFMEASAEAGEAEVLHEPDAVLPLFLRWWALQAQGSVSVAADTRALLLKLRPDFPLPPVESELPSLLMIVESGLGPVKKADGVQSNRMAYFRALRFTDVSVDLAIDGGPREGMYLAEDVWWQAVTRGRRDFDNVAANRARVANSTASVGRVAGDIGEYMSTRSMYSGSGAESQVGLALTLTGAAFSLFSSRVRAAVDARYWDNLPDGVHIAWFYLAPGRHQVAIIPRDEHGAEVLELSQTIVVDVSDKSAGANVVWVATRDRPSRYLAKQGDGK